MARPFRPAAVALACFLLHLGLTAFHTWVLASHGNTLPIPRPPAVFAPDAPDHWGNALDLNRWDSVLYEAIVEHGFRDPADPARAWHTVMWFPGYPLLAGAIRHATGWKPTVVFSLLSVGCALAAWLLLWSAALGRALGTRTQALASLLILCWPGAFWWFDGMPEPVAVLLFLLAIHCFLARRPWALALGLGVASGVKQFFAPVAFIFLLLELGETRRITASTVARALLSIAGFVLFLGYCGWAFGQPLVSFQMDMATFHRHPSPLALVDLGHTWRCLGTRGGNTAVGTLLVLALAAVPCLRGPRLHAALWCLAAGTSAFFISADAYTPAPFASILRYQTMDLPLFLVAALLLARGPTRALILGLLPLGGAGLYLQARYAVDWWMWRWVA